MLSRLVRLDILMRMEKNGANLNSHVSHNSIFDILSRRTPSGHFSARAAFLLLSAFE